MTDPRTEAERLVATLLGGASMAADSLKGFATGSAECCVCPVCKAIAAARDPDPDLAGRLADGAGEIAAGVAGVLRAFAGGAQPKPAPAEPAAPAAGDDVWAAATRAERSPEKTPPKPMAKKATKPKAAPEDSE
ncbi:hypothetical protein Val02_67060 [Virgisporangium aliadipatigenens]|uniref:Uncharacterized protein n=1 Tax=Virgisporangium aliadipatigenens TaxID=741659 RepID=A0A8J3YTY2_9ACTN|nr:hypothetical protein Val02_67060 [Virgisporangium aliadipatigenens]